MNITPELLIDCIQRATERVHICCDNWRQISYVIDIDDFSKERNRSQIDIINPDKLVNILTKLVD